jgi:hypothetical protein
MFYRMIDVALVLTCRRRRQVEAELLSVAGSTLLVGDSLEEVEDDDGGVAVPLLQCTQPWQGGTLD